MGSSSVHTTKVMLGLEEKNEVDKACEAMCPKMTMKQRLIGYGACFGLGSLLNIFSWGSLRKMFDDPPDPVPFVMLFIFGNIIQLAAGMFFSGPVAYGKKLLSPEMRCAAFFYFTAMICLCVVAFQPTITGTTDDGKNECSEGDDCTLEPEGVVGLVCMMVVVTYICMVWFVICSVPFGKRIACACMEKTCEKCCGGRCKALTDCCCKKKKKKTTAKTSTTARRKSDGSSTAGAAATAAAGTMSALLSTKTEQPGKAKASQPTNSTGGGLAGLFRASASGTSGGGAADATAKQPDVEEGRGGLLSSFLRKPAPEPAPAPEPEPEPKGSGLSMSMFRRKPEPAAPPEPEPASAPAKKGGFSRLFGTDNSV